MSNRKSERLLNLLILLLVQRHFVTKDRIREMLYGDQSSEAFEKMFERDKEELRSLGVPIEVGALDAFFDDELGYRVNPKEFALPSLQFTADEAAVVSVATKVWDHARLAGVTTDAVRKMAAEGVSVDADALDILTPRIGVEEPSFEAFWDATLQRVPVAFDYARAGEEPTRRRLEPWRVVRSSGRWYAVGRDLDREDTRVFRLSRVRGLPEPIGEPGAFEVPELTDANALVRAERTDHEPELVTLRVVPGRGAPLRQRAERIVEGEAYDEIQVRGIGDSEVLSYGADVVVVSPPSVRARVLARLQEAAR